MKIIIRFKNGFELPIICENFSVTKNTVTGEIHSYAIDGIINNKPIFFRSSDVECIWQDMKYEWDGEL